MAWHPLVIPAILALVMGWGVGLWILFARPDQTQNRFAALLLACTSTLLFAKTAGLVLPDDPAVAHGFFGLYVTILLAMPLLYGLLLGTLETPWARPLRSSWGIGLLVAYTIGVEAWFFVSPETFFQGIRPSSVLGWSFRAGPMLRTFGVWVPIALLSVGALLTLDAAVRARGTAAAARTRAYALAFILRDAIAIGTIAYFFTVARPPWSAYLSLTLYAIEDIVFLVVLGYGILKSQLFDIDLRLKWALTRSTVAGAIAAAFFVTSEIVEALIPVDGLLFGLAAAGAVLLALRPLERLAQRLADRLMPGVQRTPEYIQARKRAVYDAAIAAANQDGEMSAEERQALDRLRRELGLPA